MSLATYKRIGVVRGGPSSEYDVSLKTGSAMLSNLADDHTPIDVFISKDGVWHINGFEKTPSHILHSVDAVVNGMHGEFGEDGSLQKMCEQFGVPVSGSSAISSALAMNKKLTKQVLSSYSIKTPHSIVVRRLTSDPEIGIAEMQKLKEVVYNALPFPLIIKPVGRGSSIGVSFVGSKDDIARALTHGFIYSDELLVEEYIEGIEVTCGVIEGFRGVPLYTLLPVGVQKHPTTRIHDYDTKYTMLDVLHDIPCAVSPLQKMQIEELARAVHRVLHLRDYSRTDMVLHPRRGLFVLEVNTLPDITHRSTFMKSLEALGGNIKEFLSHIVDRTLQRK